MSPGCRPAASCAPSYASTSAIASPHRLSFGHCTIASLRTSPQLPAAAVVPIVQFERGQRKDDLAAQYRARFQADEGVVFIGVAQERRFSFKATKHITPPQAVRFSFSRQSVVVNQYYFYVHDAELGTSLHQGGDQPALSSAGVPQRQ